MGKDYRTVKKAGNVVQMPEKYAIITHPDYKNALGLYPDGKAYLYFLGTDFDVIDNNVFFRGRPLTVSNLKDVSALNIPESIDLPLLRVFYSIFLNCQLKRIVIYLPELCRFMGKNNASVNEINGIIEALSRFNQVVGIIDGKVLPVIFVEDYCKEKNTITVSSPYMLQLIVTLMALKTKKPSHSFLIKPDIRNERNKRAIEMVHILIVLIEEAGNHSAHIRASNLVNRNPLLKCALDRAAPADKNKLLRRTFSKAWELIKTRTDILQKYKDFNMPDSIPTMSKLNVVYEFTHKGKSK